MAGKKLINDVAHCVDHCLEGLVAVNPGLRLLEGHRVVIRSDIDQVKSAGKVTLLSGGGSAHEPAHGGYVGEGMLSAAVAGSVFTSPPPGDILAGVMTVGQRNEGGTLLIIKNYTGDRLNFGIAAERAKAKGLNVEMVVVGEDCALTSADKTAGRRGLAGTVFVHKIAGALAEEGTALSEIVTVCNKAAGQMGTIGMSLSPCSVPGSGPSFQLAQDEMELGLGIHGEAGVRRMKLLPAKEAVSAMMEHMTDSTSTTHLKIAEGNRVALMINNLGGTSVLELNIVAKEAIEWLEKKGVVVCRAYCGSYMTSLEMAGVSLTILHVDDIVLKCLDAPTSACGWSKPFYGPHLRERVTPPAIKPEVDNSSSSSSKSLTGAQVDYATSLIVHKAVSYACAAVGHCERQLTALDSQSGDGDCGSTLKRGTDAILSALGPAEAPGLPITCPASLLLEIASVVEQQMGGSSGALYSLFLTSAAGPLMVDTSPMGWCEALGAGIVAVMRYGGAEPGDRTMVDSLHAAHSVLVQDLPNMKPLDAMGKAVHAAEQKAIETASMTARAGRASYVSRDHLTQPDPGAHAVGIWMRAAYEGIKQTFH